MADFSNYLESALLNATLRNTTYTSPSVVYIGLYTTDPTDANVGTEVTGGSYSRQSATFAAPSGGSVTTNADVTFPTATDNWGTVTHFGILDAATAGNLLYHGDLNNSKTINTGDILKIEAGNLTVTLD
jgi:hypothetical protein